MRRRAHLLVRAALLRNDLPAARAEARALLAAQPTEPAAQALAAEVGAAAAVGAAAEPPTTPTPPAPAAAPAPADAPAPLVSALTGLTLPAGGERVLETSAVEPLAARFETRLQPRGLTARRVELWAWPVATAAATTQAVEEALRAAGFTAQVDPPQRTDNGTLTMFAALCEARHTALIGLWLRTDALVLLAWAELAARPAPTAAPDSARAPEGGARTSPALPRLPALAPRPGTVRGRLVDAHGQPLANGKVLLWGTTSAGGRRDSYPVAVRDGSYELEVPDGVYALEATTRVGYHDREFQLALHPLDGSGLGQRADSRTGIVRDFALLASGRCISYETMGADFAGSYYGGWLSLHQERSLGPTTAPPLPDGLVTVTLVPDGPLLDGSPGQTIQSTIDFGRVYSGKWYDIPLGRYRVSATIALRADGRTYGLKVSARPSRAEPQPPAAPSAIFEFSPASGQQLGAEEVRLLLTR